MEVGMYSGSFQKYVDDPAKFYSVEEGIKLIADAGFECVDFTLSPAFAEMKKNGEGLEEYFTRLRKYAESLGVRINQTHAHTWAFDEMITEDGQRVSEAYLNEKADEIAATHYLGAEYIVIHPVQPPWAIYDREADYRKRVNLDFFTRLRPYLEKYDVIECIENLFRRDPETDKLVPAACSRPEEILYYIDRLGEDRFCACLDVGHMKLTGDYTGDTIVGAIKKLGKHLKVLHVHENKKVLDDHLPPYLFYYPAIPDPINWKEVIAALKEVGYSGVFNLEILTHRVVNYTPHSLRETLKYIRALCDPDKME